MVGVWVYLGIGSVVVRVLGIMENLAEVRGSLHSMSSAKGDWGYESWSEVGWVCSGTDSVMVVTLGSIERQREHR